MRIGRLTLERGGDSPRISAQVSGEECDQPAREVFIATEPPFGEWLTPGPHPFLVGCLLPALHYGERRVLVEEGELCPSLLENLATVMGIMRHWSGGGLRPLAIEGRRAPGPAFGPRRRAAMFFSGGIDSLATLRANHRNFPVGHPGRVRELFLVHGFDIGGVVARGAKYEVFRRARERLGRVAAEVGCPLVPAYTNLRHLHDERMFWLNRFYSAVLAAVAHAFVGRYDLFYLASGLDLAKLDPCGSHPLLDPEYGSYDLRFKHAHLELARIAKIKFLADWPAALDNLGSAAQRPCTLQLWPVREMRADNGRPGGGGGVGPGGAFAEDDLRRGHNQGEHQGLSPRGFYASWCPIFSRGRERIGGGHRGPDRRVTVG